MFPTIIIDMLASIKKRQTKYPGTAPPHEFGETKPREQLKRETVVKCLEMGYNYSMIVSYWERTFAFYNVKFSKHNVVALTWMYVFCKHNADIHTFTSTILVKLLNWESNYLNSLSALAAVQQSGLALEFVAVQDRDIVLAAVRQSGSALEYASAALRADRAIVLAAVQQNGSALQYAASALKADSEIVLAAVRQNGSALQYAALFLHADDDIVMAAVQQNGLALEFACFRLIHDENIVFAAAQQNWKALEFASRVADNFKLFWELVKPTQIEINIRILTTYASKCVRADAAIVERALGVSYF
jgi:hypothetical protein